MSQHNISGSEAFNLGPSVHIRQYRPGGLRRRRARTALVFIAGAGAMLVAGLVAAAAILAPNLAG